MMKCLNTVTDALKNPDWTDRGFVVAMSEAVEIFVLLLAPAAPFSADELWESIGRNGFTLDQAWPRYSESIAAEDTVTIAVQVNGKLRDTITLGADASSEEMEAAALSSDKVRVHTDGKQVRKVIVIPAKLVNIVAQ
jgi:leucyl-tRNA synthetase